MKPQSHLLILFALGACTTPPAVSETTSKVGGEPDDMGTVAYRACRADVFYVDVANERASVPAPLVDAGAPGGFRDQVAKDFRTEIRSKASKWIGDSCSAKQIFVVERAVLDARPNAALVARQTAHDRFHRFEIVCRGEEGSETIKVRPEYLCEAVESLRAIAESHAGPRSMLFVGRECEALGLGNEDAPTQAMKTWHLSSLGLEAPAPSISGEPMARLTLIDSGVPSHLRSALGVSSSPDFVTSTGVAGYGRHGSAMASLARQLAPEVELHVPRVLDAANMGTGEGIARGLDDTLFGAGAATTEPQVIGLSLGWSPELADRSGILGRTANGSTCQSYEDPFGEPVKLLMGLARRLDEDVRRLFVVAAAGNATAGPAPNPALDPIPDLQAVSLPSVLPSPLSTSCHGDIAQPWFLPAGYGAATSCMPGGSVAASAYPVSPIRFDNTRSALAVETETPLVAIGEHVFASAPVTASPSFCTDTFPTEVRLPAAMSGSSVSAAFTAAEAAHVQQTLRARGQAPLDWSALARLLELSAQPLCRTNALGAPVARLDAARAERAALGCPSLVSCAGTGGSCATEVAQCFGSTPSCAAKVTPPPLGSQTAAMCTLTRRRSTTTVAAGSTCGSDCTAESGFERYALAGAGPQPEWQGCSFCALNLLATPAPSIYEMFNWFELSPELEGSTISNPQMHVVFVGPNGTQERWINLDGVTQPGDWFAGNTVELVMPVDFNLPSGFVVDNVKAELDLLIESTYGDGEPAVDSNPLVVELN